MKMILLLKQTVTDITSISFYELVLNEYSVSNRIKLGLTWNYVVDINRRIDSCPYMLTQASGNTAAHR